MYAGEPYVATANGYLLPMDPSQICQYPHPGAIPYMPMSEYPYPMMHPGVLPQQYMETKDEGFVSVEHTPQLPDNLPEPSSEGGAETLAAETDSAASGSNSGNSAFGPLGETEKQEIEDILSETSPTKSETVADMSDSGVSEADELRPSSPCQETSFESNSKNAAASCATSEESLKSVPADSCDSLDVIVIDEKPSEISVRLTEVEIVAEALEVTVDKRASVTKEEILVNGVEAKIDSKVTKSRCDSKLGKVDIQTETTKSDVKTEVVDKVETSVTEDSVDIEVADNQIDEVEVKAEVIELDDVLRTSAPEISFSAEDLNDSSFEFTSELSEQCEEVTPVEEVIDVQQLIENCESEVLEVLENQTEGVETILEALPSPAECLKQEIADLESASTVAESQKLEIAHSKSSSHSLEGISSVVQNSDHDTLYDAHSSCQSSRDISEKSDVISLEEKTLPSSNRNQISRNRDAERAAAILTRGIRGHLESIAEESSGSLSDSSLRDEDQNFIHNLSQEKEAALTLLQSREVVKGKPVTEAVIRWIREVTPEKAFNLSEVNKSQFTCQNFSDTSSDEYSEDEYIENANHKCEALPPISNNSQQNNTVNQGQSSKNVKGNPLVAARCSECCSVAASKRVANTSPSVDELEDYDGCSTVSGLSQGPLFSNSNSVFSSQSSSRTITPSRTLGDGDDVTNDTDDSSRCYPDSYKKYYQIAPEVDDSPLGTAEVQSPCDVSRSQSASSDQVLPLAAEILRSHSTECNIVKDIHSSCPCSKKTSLPEDSHHTAPTQSRTSSGIGSSLASTPANSPQRLPRHSHTSVPRFPFLLLPPNMRAETGTASLNDIHCCSIM